MSEPLRAVSIVWMDAVTPLGSDWPTTWRRLLGGEIPLRPWHSDRVDFQVQAQVSAVAPLDRSLTPEGLGAAGRLLADMERRIHAAAGGRVRCYGASNHGETRYSVANTPTDPYPSSR